MLGRRTLMFVLFALAVVASGAVANADTPQAPSSNQTSLAQCNAGATTSPTSLDAGAAGPHIKIGEWSTPDATNLDGANCSLFPSCPCLCIQACYDEGQACSAACGPQNPSCSYECRQENAACVDQCCGYTP